MRKKIQSMVPGKQPLFLQEFRHLNPDGQYYRAEKFAGAVFYHYLIYLEVGNTAFLLLLPPKIVE
jgi:hypothetical protein